MSTRAFYVAGEALAPNAGLEVFDKFNGSRVATVAKAKRADIDRAIAAAVGAERVMREMPTFKRRLALEHVVRRLTERAEEFARALMAEAGKPISLARGEVGRAIDTFRMSAEECGRVQGETIALDVSARGVGYQGLWKRVPVGACSFVLPFNFPLNLLAHKVGPAIAIGCPFVAKPDPRTPLTALMLGEVLAETELPKGSWSILPVVKDGIELFSEDERIKLLSFTGSPSVGWKLKERAGQKRVVLELGGNAACIVDADVDVEKAAAKIVSGAFAYAGQSCISVQRVLAHRSVYEPLKRALVERAVGMKTGDPRDEGTMVGPLISEKEAIRVEEWVKEAVSKGARVLCGGERKGSVMAPTLVEGVALVAKLSCQEAFGPVATLAAFDDFGAAIRVANESEFGLQCGVFTDSLERVKQAFEELEVGGVIVNDVPTWRMDNMPYGGLKQSGLGREGVRFAMEEMTDVRVLVVSGSS